MHFVSIIMPTLNAAALLENCLRSISAQTYPRDRYEILLADGGSNDGTQEIGRRFGAIIIDDRASRNMEESKRVALAQARGEFILFVDADNELTHPDYLELAVKELAENPQALGVEAYYPPSRKMTSLCAYLTHHLHISDPLCWLMAETPVRISDERGERPLEFAGGTPALREIERWTLPEGSYSYPLGANGFLFRKADLEAVKAEEKFQDTHVAMFLMRAGKREWLRLRGRGVHHYYITTLWNFIQKRRRATVHFLRVQEQVPVNWMKERPPVPLWLAGLYCVTFVGPVWHTLRGLVRDRDWRWLWHVPACLGSVAGAAWGVWTYRMCRHDAKLVANLKPKQGLKS